MRVIELRTWNQPGTLLMAHILPTEPQGRCEFPDGTVTARPNENWKSKPCVVQILKKCPNHGETLAMKGINLFCLYPERRTEAHDIAKAALKADMQSHMCWHVFGILHKSDRDYPQAAKCYLNALKWDPENLNLFRELSNIQMQTRDVKGLVETASKMLSLKSNNRNNWMLLAVAHHLDKNHSTAAEVRLFMYSYIGAGVSCSSCKLQHLTYSALWVQPYTEHSIMELGMSQYPALITSLSRRSSTHVVLLVQAIRCNNSKHSRVYRHSLSS